MESIVCNRCLRDGHTNISCVEVYDVEGNEIQNLETPQSTNHEEGDDIFPYDDDDDDVYFQNSDDRWSPRWSQKEWAEKDDNFDEQERLFHLQVQQEEQEFEYEDHTDLYNNEHYNDF
jgi:hypothetical protein